MIIFTIIFALINAVAVCVIAYYAYANNKLIQESHKREKEFREQLTEMNERHQQESRDLYQAIVISTILSGPQGSNRKAVDKVIQLFEQHYVGKTQVFRRNDDARANN